MLLITETNFSGVNSGHVLDKDGKKSYHIEGIFLQAEQKNRNGRIYPSYILEREVDRYTRDYIANSRSIGELNHPQEPSVNPERACHLIESLTKQGNNWIGRSKILSTPVGNIVKGLLDDGVQLGVSSRGLGTLTDKEDAKYVNEDFYMSTIDVVSDPSAPSAWVNGIFEGKEFYMGNDEEFIEKVKDNINKTAAKVKRSALDEEVAFYHFKALLQKLAS